MLLADIKAIESRIGVRAVVEAILQIVNPDVVESKARALDKTAGLIATVQDFIDNYGQLSKYFDNDPEEFLRDCSTALGAIADTAHLYSRVQHARGCRKSS